MSDIEGPVNAGEFVLHGTERDVLSANEHPPSRWQRRMPGLQPALRKLGASIAAIATVLAVVVVGGGVTVAYRQLSGGGPQPDKYAPASTFAFAKVDLDPSAGQKIAAYRFAHKFPS